MLPSAILLALAPPRRVNASLIITTRTSVWVCDAAFPVRKNQNGKPTLLASRTPWLGLFPSRLPLWVSFASHPLEPQEAFFVHVLIKSGVAFGDSLGARSSSQGERFLNHLYAHFSVGL